MKAAVGLSPALSPRFPAQNHHFWWWRMWMCGDLCRSAISAGECFGEMRQA